ncbi:Peroxisomal NADH pyrophosphatase nudt12 [Dinochytrium kinnereticum]|nr:Peroxisomal NADH pyrophosphatase nudt12 [Dinochytrium kinnereticum]
MTLESVFESIVARDLPKLRSLLESTPSLALQTNDRSWTPLHMAARYGYSDGIKLLLNFKADTRALTKDMKSPIDLALSWSNLDAARELGWKEGEAGSTYQSYLDPVRNFFAGSPLNRSSELRSNEAFLEGKLSESKFIALKRLNVPIKDKKILYLTYKDVELVLAKRTDDLTLVFLGVDSDKTFYWAFDATSQESVQEAVVNFGGQYQEFRPAGFTLSEKEAAITAQARAIVDWNNRANLSKKERDVKPLKKAPFVLVESPTTPVNRGLFLPNL